VVVVVAVIAGLAVVLLQHGASPAASAKTPTHRRPTTPGGSSTQASTSSSTQTSTSTAPAPLSDAAWVSRVASVLRRSKVALDDVTSALAGTGTSAGRTEATALLENSIDARSTLIETVDSWHVRPDAGPLDALLVRSFRASIRADRAYVRYVALLDRGSTTAAEQLKSRITNVLDSASTGSKHAFLRKYNAFRMTLGLAPVFAKTLY
jgi:hypothetical protein